MSSSHQSRVRKICKKSFDRCMQLLRKGEAILLPYKPSLKLDKPKAVISRVYAQITPALARLIRNRHMVTYKQFTAGVLVFVFLFITGAFDTTGAVSSNDLHLAELLTAYRVTIDGNELGNVIEQDIVRQMIEDIRQGAARQMGMEAVIEADLSFEDVRLSPSELTQIDLLEKAITENVTVKAKAFALVVDGEEIGILRSENEASRVLEQVMAPYAAEESQAVEEISFAEDVEIVPATVDPSQVEESGAFVERIIRGSEAIEEYVVVEGDTLWDISRAFEMDIETVRELNPELQGSDNLKLGQTLRLSLPHFVLNVAVTEVAVYEEAVPFKTETRKDDSMYKNQTKVIQQGKKGLRQVEARVYKVNGIEKSREILSEEVLEEPVTKIVAEGTKSVPATASRGGGALLWPTMGSISSPFGKRWGSMHTGIDIANASGTPVYAAEAGKVVFSAYSGNYGNLIKVDHGGGMVTYYAHLKTRVGSVGQRVDRGQLIGYMGSTGRSTGPHLHFEVRINNTPVDPKRYLR